MSEFKFKGDFLASFTPYPEGSEAFETSFAPLPAAGRLSVGVKKEIW